MKLSVCINTQGIIGKDLNLIYSFKSDLIRFKELTSKGKDPHVVMGRLTYDSIGKPLPNRTNIVISNTLNEIPGCIVMDLHTFIDKYKSHPNMWIIGGGQIYKQLIDFVDVAYITYVQDDKIYDTSYININETLKFINSEFIPANSSLWSTELNRINNSMHSICFFDYERK